MGLTVLKTPVRCPQANAFCERLIGTMRRECLDWLIVLNERHLRPSCRSGWHTTTRADATPAWVQAFQTCRSTGSRGQMVTESLMAIESLPPQSWRGCITNIAWKVWQHES